MDIAVTGYRLYSDLGLLGNYYLVYDGSENSNMLSYVHTGLNAGFTYSYELEVLNFNGPSAMSPVASRAACEAPSGFNNLYLKSTSQTQIIIGWTQPADDGGCTIQGYTVQMDSGPSTSLVDFDTSISPSTF